MESDRFKKEVNALLDQPCANSLTTKSVMQILVEDYGVEEIQKAVSNPLQGLKVVPYYGCLMNRPPEVMDFDDPENPTAMDRILTALGLEVLDFPLKVECCGGSFGVARHGRPFVGEAFGYGPENGSGRSSHCLSFVSDESGPAPIADQCRAERNF
jgi:heterodisulfide reductase subunit B